MINCCGYSICKKNNCVLLLLFTFSYDDNYLLAIVLVSQDTNMDCLLKLIFDQPCKHHSAGAETTLHTVTQRQNRGGYTGMAQVNQSFSYSSYLGYRTQILHNIAGTLITCLYKCINYACTFFINLYICM